MKYSKAEKKLRKPDSFNSILTNIDPKDIGLAYKNKENEFDDFMEEILLPHKLSTNGSFFTVADVNGDGLEDLILGGAAVQKDVL